MRRSEERFRQMIQRAAEPRNPAVYSTELTVRLGKRVSNDSIYFSLQSHPLFSDDCGIELGASRIRNPNRFWKCQRKCTTDQIKRAVEI